MAKVNVNVDAFRIIAHRGLHNKDISENSLKAFSKAIENNIPFEFDVHLSKDREIVVCHDADLERVTGKKGYIPELTLEEIKRDYRLRDGQEVPTLKEVMELNPGIVPMVIELKVDKGNYKALVNVVKPLLSQIKEKEKATIISFDPRALAKCKGLGFSRGFLLCKEHDGYKVLAKLFDYIDVETTMVEDPAIMKYRKKGGLVNVWTVETIEDAKRLAPNVDMLTFQHIEVDGVRKVMEK